MSEGVAAEEVVDELVASLIGAGVAFAGGDEGREVPQAISVAWSGRANPGVPISEPGGPWSSVVVAAWVVKPGTGSNAWSGC
jgi:hypothetical protein